MRDEPYVVRYFVRRDGTIPAQEFLRGCPNTIASKVFPVLIAVAEAPPHKFAGGGYWEAMHGAMSGFFEVRVDGPPGGTHYRLFCLLEDEPPGFESPALVIVTGMSKSRGTVLSEADYSAVRSLGEDYYQRSPRPLT